jgi:nitrogen fixation/metabolism regulation signal transduction histidine kinase
MASEQGARRRRSALSRVWLYCLLLALPALLFAGILLYREHLGTALSILAGAGLVLYLALVAASLIESLSRPLHTLSNVVSSMREGDYSLRAHRAARHDALSGLAEEINALVDLLQNQRVHSLESTALLTRILEVMRAPLFAFDRENLLRLVNDAGLKMLGLPYGRCIGRSASELGLANLLEAPDQSIHSFSTKPARWLLRKAAFRQDGAPHTLLLLADVSLPLQEEEQLAWKRLIRVLGHELSNSLAPIKSIAGSLLSRVDLLGDDESARADFRRGLTVVEARADSLHRFVQSYRQLAQLPPPQLRQISLGALLERVAQLEQRVPIQVDPGPVISFNADPDQLEHMLINLLTNAADASLANGTKPVRVTWKIVGSDAFIVMEDRGMGVANLENLFVPFYTTKAAGSGIGLVLAQQIARAHGGEISLQNRDDGEGARATVRLPLART